MALDIQDIVVFLGLSRLRGIGFHSLRELGDIHGLAARLRTQVGEELLVKLFSSNESPEQRLSSVEDLGNEAYRVLNDRGMRMVAIGDEKYPSCFYDLGEKNRPHWFFYQGDVDLLEAHNVTVVGTRAPTDMGEFLVRYSVSALKDLAVNVVSGLAKGVDEIAHEWALRSNIRNISVLGTGLLKVYPSRNASLASRIVDAGGVLISEYAPDAEPNKESFVWRNRLQAALGSCVVAPEWKASSGTAHTIRYAKQLGRPTINVWPAGLSVEPDHGVADHSFVIPSEHDDFVRTIQRSFGGSSLSTERQMNLFGLSG